MRIAFALTLITSASLLRAGAVDFARDIQPLFAEYCFECHGPDKAKGGLVLTSRDAVLKELESGDHAVVPGNLEQSTLITRLFSTDADEMMPPKKKEKRPKPAEIELIKKWIASGAEWSVHWAYRPIVKPKTTSSIDAFVRATLAEKKIAPSPEADRHTLIKRVFYDLLGLPPTPEEVDAFVNDKSPDAYAKLVERALASPHFGERWGRHWLDRARYADSDGYEKDKARPDAWRYRDWVIEAVNRDMPFDQFSIEQLAGDLLPNPTPEQILATAFHRQTLTNTEGGVDQEQFRNEAVFDRTETTGSVWLAHTVGCARCHNHKYDQISQAEYYRMFAFFNNAAETNAKVGVSAAELAAFEKKNAAHAAKLRALQAKLAKARAPLFDKLLDWEKETNARLVAVGANKPDPEPLALESVTSDGGTKWLVREDHSATANSAGKDKENYTVVATLPAAQISALRLDVLADTLLPGQGPGRSPNGNFVLSEIEVRTDAGPVELHSPGADFSQKGFLVAAAIDGKPETGWGVGGGVGKSHDATFRFVRPIDGAKTPRITVTLSHQYGKEHAIGRFRLVGLEGETSESIVPAELKRLLAIGSEKWTNESKDQIVDWLVKLDPAASAAADALEAAEESGPKPPLMDVRVLAQRRVPRKTHVFHRGEFLSPAELVRPGTPAILPPIKGRNGEPDRLDFAHWLVSRDNPLTARVIVNQFWMHLFGEGLVRTPADFGVRGDRPTHAELLDWLASEFVAKGWSRKQLIRIIMTSATYRQRSDTRADLNDLDPRNTLLARQNRLRVEGEVVRDLHLAAGGLLSRKIGGPSVFPPQPPEIAALSYAGNFKWTDSKGDDRYRRGMYTFFKRTAPYPDLMTFDCPDANTANIRRTVSNTPLQALTTLNADTFNEAARALAARALKAGGDDNARLSCAFQLCLVRAPRSEESAALLGLLNDARAYYATHADDAKKMGGDIETAAWTGVTRIILNTDEFITRE
ncbi:MAG: PSD1 and planctomycete cytochrome C domain-containing protein [Chthoniobacteraceae bacterium]